MKRSGTVWISVAAAVTVPGRPVTPETTVTSAVMQTLCVIVGNQSGFFFNMQMLNVQKTQTIGSYLESGTSASTWSEHPCLVVGPFHQLLFLLIADG